MRESARESFVDGWSYCPASWCVKWLAIDGERGLTFGLDGAKGALVHLNRLTVLAHGLQLHHAREVAVLARGIAHRMVSRTLARRTPHTSAHGSHGVLNHHGARAKHRAQDEKRNDTQK